MYLFQGEIIKMQSSIKKIFTTLLLSFTFILASSSLDQEPSLVNNLLTLISGNYLTITKTGFYGLYIKKMPFWTFWNTNTIFELIAETTGISIEAIQPSITLGLPVLLTQDYNQAIALQQKLADLNCDAKVEEMKFKLDMSS